MADFNFTTPVVSLSTSDAASEARKSKYDAIASSSFVSNLGTAAKVGLYVGVAVGVATIVAGGARCLSNSIFGNGD
ncbi:MAG: hypothetical protein PHQ58_04130 [Rhodoferax sp.]|uniref:hypothetical protein n=1 Tax=Rhodoferax sp. TaxID=50421 RepID=UPI0026187FF9|nr:hypothetical protein [Rhodoferax sp.]MDD2879602.1 hypothetical protein [Rhodoferax sp.]